MIPRRGDWLRSKLTGRLFQVGMFIGYFAVLEGEDPSSRVYTEIGNLTSLYEQVEIKRYQEESSLSLGPEASPHGVLLEMTRGE
jgi:hypothetical protein